MEVLEDIFVPYDIAVQLKEIGFDEKCMAFFEKDIEFKIHTTVTERLSTVYLKEIKSIDYNAEENVLSLPTWEQVKKWFRDKGLECHQIHSTYDDPITYVLGVIDHNDKPIDPLKYIYQSHGTYEEARKTLILKLIEIYKNECKK